MDSPQTIRKKIAAAEKRLTKARGDLPKAREAADRLEQAIGVEERFLEWLRSMPGSDGPKPVLPPRPIKDNPQA